MSGFESEQYALLWAVEAMGAVYMVSNSLVASTFRIFPPALLLSRKLRINPTSHINAWARSTAETYSHPAGMTDRPARRP